MSRKLFLHGGVYGLSRVANQSIGFLLIPLYARLLADEGYGVIRVLGSVSAFLGFVFLQGLHGAWLRLRFDQDGPEALRRFESTIVWYLVGACVAGVGLLSLVGEPLAAVVTPGIPYWPLGLLTAVTAAATVFAALYERKLQAEQRPAAFALFSAVRTLLTLGAILWFVAALRRGAAGRIEAGALAAGLVAVAALFLLRPGPPRLVSGPSLRRSLAYGLPLVPHNLAGLTNNLIDSLLVNALLGAAATGVYGMGYQLASLGLIVARALNQAFRPLFIETMKRSEAAAARGDAEGAARAARSAARSGLALVAAVAALVLVVNALAREALVLLTTEDFYGARAVIPPVAAGIVAWSAYAVFSQSISYDVSRVRFLSVITLSAAALNVAGNLVLIPRIGILGAAWTTLASNALMALLALWIGRRCTPVPHEWRRWGVLLGACAAGLAVPWWLDAGAGAPGIGLALKLVVAGAAAWVALRAAGATPAAIRGLFAGGGGA